MLRIEKNFDKIRLYSLEFTTNIGCKLDCRFCPQEAAVKAYYDYTADSSKPVATLTFENFKKIYIRLEKNSIVSFSGTSEPLANPETIAMIHYACENNSKIALFTTLQSSARHDMEKLKDVPFLSFVVHVPDEEGNSKFDITEEYIQTLTYTVENFTISSLSCHGTIHHAVKGIIEKSDLRVDTTILDRAGYITDPQVKTSPQTDGRIICVFNPNLAEDITNLIEEDITKISPIKVIVFLLLFSKLYTKPYFISSICAE